MGTITRRGSRALAAVLAVLVAVGGFSVTAISTAAAATDDPGLMAWGANAAGQLSNGGTVAQLTPATVSGVPEAMALAAGDQHSLAVRANGDVVSWGSNRYGQLGDGTQVNRSAPVSASGLAGANAVAAGTDHSLALRNGEVWAWGSNASGQLGNGTLVSAKAPIVVPGLTNVISISAGEKHSLAVRADGTVWAWGGNANFQLGDGTVATRMSPVQVTGISDAFAVAAGAGHSLALRRDGTVWAWGANNYGQLGDNTSTARKIAVQVSGAANVVEVSSGMNHSVALLADGTLQAWGQNTYGQLGEGTTTGRRVATAVAGLTGITRVAAGGSFTMGVSGTGSVFTWGQNTQGQLGLGDKVSRPLPTAVPGAVGAATPAAGAAHALVARAVPVMARPVSEWRADANLDDAIGTSPATAATDISYTNGKLRCSWSFAKTTSSVTLPQTAALEPGNSFTFGAWVSPRTLTGLQTIAAKATSGATAWALRTVDGRLEFTLSADGSALSYVTTASTVLETNRWQHVAVAYDGLQVSSARVRLYVDGLAVASSAAPAAPATIAIVGAPTRLGAAPKSTAINANVDEVRFFDTALTAGQVADMVTLDAANAGEACDSQAPTTSATIAPLPNDKGWSRAGVNVTLTGADNAGGVGVASLTYSAKGATTLADTTVTGASVTLPVAAEGETTFTVTATDAVGNVSMPATYKARVDGSAPVIVGVPNLAPNAFGWNRGNLQMGFTCSDALSGIAICPEESPVQGEGENLSISGTATDTAGNTATVTVGGLRIDRTKPTLVGTPEGAPNAAGWYRQDVPVKWVATDALSGVDESTIPVGTTIRTDGTTIAVLGRVYDKAGNNMEAMSAEVNLDRRAPTTRITAPRYASSAATLTLLANDATSGVAGTFYSVDGGPTQSGTVIELGTDGDHTVRYWSTDVADNVEAPQTASVLIDRTAPTIKHDLEPNANREGWNTGNVKVTFICEDEGSGIASCTGDDVVTGEGSGFQVHGEAVDRAGNKATDTATVNIDRGLPTIAALLDRAPDFNGWYNAAITARFECNDTLSGIFSCPNARNVTEGIDRVVNGETRDLAGNTAKATAGPINVDLTAPALTGSPTTEPNAAGWHHADVTVTWTCSDQTSGIAGDCPTDALVTGEGEGLVAAASVSDNAAHTTSLSSVVRIDRTAPVTTVTVPEPGIDGVWDRMELPVTVTDALSGVGETFYSVDGGEIRKTATSIVVTGSGNHSVRYWSTDLAGNVEADNLVAVQLDGLAPTISGALEPAANVFGWNNSATRIVFTCADAESGIESCGPNASADAEGAGQEFVGTAKDNAGNTAKANVTANVDLTRPTITGAAGSAPNAAGWYNKPVAVGFTCDDKLSGIVSCPVGVVLAEDGRDQTVTGEAGDKAGNLATATVDGINLDSVAPVTVATLPDADANGYYGRGVAVTMTATDELSGVERTMYALDGTAEKAYTGPITVTGGGTHTIAFRSVDVAGNGEIAQTLSVNVDGTPPTITGKGYPLATAKGWNNTAVSVQFTCTDGESGVVSCGPDAVVSKEGQGQLVPGTAVDAAGNSASTEVKVNIDLTAPAVTGKVTTAPNAAGWYKAPVAADFTCTDTLSGVATCPAAATLSTEGANQSVSGQATDNAGNTGTGAVGGLNLDMTAPVTVATLPAPAAPGWYGSSVAVTLAATDALSGVERTMYSLDGAVEKAYTGPIAITGGGSHTVKFRSVDVAGNAEVAQTLTVSLDGIAPTITGKGFPLANAKGWNNTPVSAQFTCADGQSGIVTCGPNAVVSKEGANQVVPGKAVDVAGNTASTEVKVNIDLTAPAVTGKARTAPNSAGWYKAPVAADFTCTDTLSGVATCPTAVTFNTEGSGLTASGQAADNAGNLATGTVGGINLDMTAPALAIKGITSGGSYTQGSVPTATCEASDALSGLAGACSMQTTISQCGSYTLTAAVTDRAGNMTTAYVSYRVTAGRDDDDDDKSKYEFNGFLGGLKESNNSQTQVQNAGSTIPMQFELLDSKGRAVVASGDQLVLEPVSASKVSGPFAVMKVTKEEFSQSGKKYQYNWKTTKAMAGKYWRIGVKLSDGSIEIQVVYLK